MAHLTAIHHANGKNKASEAAIKLADKAQSLLHLSSDTDEFTTSVYGSRFAGEDLPRLRMPESQMPREIAYRLIKDDLSLDNNPKLK